MATKTVIDRFTIRFGGLAPCIQQQILGQGRIPQDGKRVEQWQKLADAVILLNCHGLLSDKNAKAARDGIERRVLKGTVPLES